MKYILYSYPNCGKCDQVKEHLKQKGISYQEINAGLGEGRVNFREFYSKNKERIQRGEGGILLPILVNDGQIFQGLENILENI